MHDDAIARNYRAGYYNACDGKGWQKQAEGLSVEASEARDDDAWHAEMKRWGDSARPAFVVGQTISTLAEYEALPVGATVWPWDGDKEHHYTRTADGYTDGLWIGKTHSMSGDPRVIRSLP